MLGNGFYYVPGERYRKLTGAYGYPKMICNMVIEYAELSSAEGLVSSAVLAPEFGERFEDTLGEVLLLAVPSRSRAFVFPQLASDVSRYSNLVWNAYRETAYPVSVELFEWRKGVLRAVGLFEP